MLGPVAVAQLLEALKPELAGPESAARRARAARRVAAPCVTLADAPRHAGTLPRSYDAEGVPRRTVAADPQAASRDGVVRRHRVGRVDRPRHPARPRRAVAASTSCSPAASAADAAELAAPIALGLA